MPTLVLGSARAPRELAGAAAAATTLLASPDVVVDVPEVVLVPSSLRVVVFEPESSGPLMLSVANSARKTWESSACVCWMASPRACSLFKVNCGCSELIYPLNGATDCTAM